MRRTAFDAGPVTVPCVTAAATTLSAKVQLIFRNRTKQAVRFVADSGSEINAGSKRKHIPQTIELERCSVRAVEHLYSTNFRYRFGVSSVEDDYDSAETTAPERSGREVTEESGDMGYSR